MMQKRTLYSLLLTSFMLVCAFSLSSAQEVTIGSNDSMRCIADQVNIDVINPSSISAFDIIVAKSSISGGADITIDSVTWYSGFTVLNVLTNRIIDLSRPDTIRIAAMMIDPGDTIPLPADYNNTVAHVYYETNDVCDGVVEIDEALWPCVRPSCCTTTCTTLFVDFDTGDPIKPAVNPGTVTIENQLPTIDDIAAAGCCDPINWSDQWQCQLQAYDADLPNGCEKLTFSTSGFPAPPVNVTPVGEDKANFSWMPGGANVGWHEISVTVTDSCGAFDETSCSLCVYNIPPEITCPDDTVIGWGDELHAFATGFDPDGGPTLPQYFLVSFDGPGYPYVNAATGEIVWATEYLCPEYTGTFELCVGVTDNANLVPGCSEENADTCCFTIKVVPFLITIEKTEKTPQGQVEEVEVFMLDDGYVNYPMGGFDFLIRYDASALTFLMAEEGSLIGTSGCAWEYFTYRFGFNGNCGPGACPTGVLRVVAIAETNNGPYHPDCFTNDGSGGPTSTDSQLVVLHFLVTDNRTFECNYIPIRFIWYDCGDNVISSKSGDTLFISRYVWEYDFDDSLPPYRIDMLGDGTYPTFFGAQADCMDTVGWWFVVDEVTGDTTWYPKAPQPQVDFKNGGIDIVCADSLDDRGDINLNGVSNEVADAVLFSNYFIYGLGVFHINFDGQVAATDVNADGMVLTVGDLVYQIRIIVGDAQPYPKVITPVNATYVHGYDGVLRVSDEVDMGAAFVVMEGDVTPTLLAPDMDLQYNFDGENTRILVWSLKGNSFTGEFLNVTGDIVSIEMATREGNPVVAELIPSDFALNQNYPNPFNPTTTIGFALPTACNYTLTVYNVSGQEVERFAGTHEAGIVEIEWDAGSLASGIYFYKLTADNFTATKKMVLLK